MTFLGGQYSLFVINSSFELTSYYRNKSQQWRTPYIEDQNACFVQSDVGLTLSFRVRCRKVKENTTETLEIASRAKMHIVHGIKE